MNIAEGATSSSWQCLPVAFWSLVDTSTRMGAFLFRLIMSESSKDELMDTNLAELSVSIDKQSEHVAQLEENKRSVLDQLQEADDDWSMHPTLDNQERRARCKERYTALDREVLSNQKQLDEMRRVYDTHSDLRRTKDNSKKAIQSQRVLFAAGYRPKDVKPIVEKHQQVVKEQQQTKTALYQQQGEVDNALLEDKKRQTEDALLNSLAMRTSSDHIEIEDAIDRHLRERREARQQRERQEQMQHQITQERAELERLRRELEHRKQAGPAPTTVSRDEGSSGGGGEAARPSMGARLASLLP